MVDTTKRKQARQQVRTRSQAASRHEGSSFDEFLDEQGIRREVWRVAVKRVLAWQIAQAKAKSA